MSSPYQKYRTSAASGWTRVDMLLAIYDATIRSLDRGIESAAHDSESRPGVNDLIDARQHLLMLIDGLDDSVGEPVPSIRRLLTFVVDRVHLRTAASWREGRQIVETLRDAFRQIADQSRELERNGQIAPLHDASAVAVRAATA